MSGVCRVTLALHVDGRRLEGWLTTGLGNTDTMDYYVRGIDFALSKGQQVSLSLRKTNPSSDAGLASLSLSAGTLSPEFDADTATYSATVANDVAEVTVTAGPQAATPRCPCRRMELTMRGPRMWRCSPRTGQPACTPSP